jgi:hypothetical protein
MFLQKCIECCLVVFIPKYRRLMSCFTPRVSVFDPISDRVRFVADREALSRSLRAIFLYLMRTVTAATVLYSLTILPSTLDSLDTGNVFT